MIHFASTRHSRLATLASLVLAVLVLAGCGGGSNGAPSSPPPPPSVSITTTSLPVGQVGNAYEATLTASGGTAPYSWSLATGSLPSAVGLSLNAASGVLAGNPSLPVAGISLPFTVTDSSKPALTTTTSLPLTITQTPLAISTSSLPNGEVGVAYSTIVAAAGGTTPYNWTITSGTLPAGLSLNHGTGAITGTPTAAATADSLTFQVTDAGSPMQTNSAPLSLTIAPPPLGITTMSLPYGQVGVAYSATFAATGGTPPYTWTLTSGTLPVGLSLIPSGSISGTPTAPATQTPLTFQAADSGNPAQKSLVVLNLPVSPAGITVTIPPQASTVAAALTVTQTVNVSVTTNDNAGVTWTLTPAGGSATTLGTSQNGVNFAVTAPSSAGVYTLAATSLTDGTRSASMTVGVTDLAGVFTWHNDLARDGVNAQEYALTTANVNTASFGKLFSCPVDGAVYAQPLWVANATIAGAQHNVVLVATQHDGLFAFDADANPCAQLWQASLIDSNHGGTSGEMSVPSVPSCRPNCFVGQDYADIEPEVGITGTPVIDPSTGTLYVVSKSVVAPNGPTNPAGAIFYQRLHAIDYTTGKEKAGSPVLITATYPGTHDGGTAVTFNPQPQNQRAGLAFVNGTLYIAWASHEDTAPYYGWVMAYTYNGTAFTQTGVFNTTPDAGNAGIWMGGAAPAADSNGHLYVITANGQFDATNASAPNTDYGDSFLQLTNGGSGLSVSSYFTPADQQCDFENDEDAGSGGSAVVLDLPGGSPAHLVIGGGKDGTLFLLNGDDMGGYVGNPTTCTGGNPNAWESFNTNAVIFSTGAFWNNTFYIAGGGTALQAFPFNSSTEMLAQSNTSLSPSSFGFPGATPSISARGASSNGIVWAIDSSYYCTNGASACAPALLHAYDATNLATEVWNNSMLPGDAAGNAVKFTLPTVANGKVYVGTRGNNIGGAYGSTSVNGELDVYGLITK